MSLSTRERIRLLAPCLRAFPELPPCSEITLERLVRSELGSLDALDSWRVYAERGQRTRAIAPQILVHVLAGNLRVSGIMSIAVGLLLGSRNIVKLPSRGDQGISAFLQRLPPPLRCRVEAVPELDQKTLASADAVVVYGRDKTVVELRERVRFDQIFLGYGHKLSLLWLGRVKDPTPEMADACARDISLFDQRGCLSPQGIYLRHGSDVEGFCDALAHALDTEAQRNPPDAAARSFEALARIEEARGVAMALGNRVWCPPRSTDWTIIHDRQQEFRFSPLNRVIYVREISSRDVYDSLKRLRGSLSTVGYAKPMPAHVEEQFLRLGACRFCPAGLMQNPRLTWHHDGRPALSDLVRWVDREAF